MDLDFRLKWTEFIVNISAISAKRVKIPAAQFFENWLECYSIHRKEKNVIFTCELTLTYKV